MIEPRPATPPDRRRRRLILGICSLSIFVVGLDATIVNVALPTIRTDFDATVAQLQWIIDAYTLVLASLLLLSGSLADRFGRTRIFRLGLVLFTVASVLCSAAPNVQVLIVARMIQAVGGSMLNPVAVSIIRNTFTDPRERAAAFGVWGGVVGLSLGLGPVLGGALVDSIGWQAIFWVNVPVGIAAILLTTRYVPESRAQVARRFDPVGQLLVIVILASLTYGIIEGPSAGWTSAGILDCFAATVVGLIVLIPYELRRPEPLLDMRFFESAPFSGATIIAVATFAAFGGFLFLNTIYLQAVRGLSPFDAGLRMLPMAAMTLVFSPLSGRLVGRYGARPSLLLGSATLTAGCVMLTGVTAATTDAGLLPGYVVFGFGFAFVNPAITNTALMGMPAAQAGVAAGLASTSRQVGFSLGVALVGVLAVPAGAGASQLAEIDPAAWWFLAGCGAASCVVGILTTGRWALATAVRSGRRLEAMPT